MWTLTTFEVLSFDCIISNIIIWWGLLNVVKNDFIPWDWIKLLSSNSSKAIPTDDESDGVGASNLVMVPQICQINVEQ